MEETGPEADEVEVSIFGPGRGEAIAVHLGDGDWITVDSCVDQASKRHSILSYFDEIGVHASEQVRLVVGTHAHDDHISGIADLFRETTSAAFVSSSAMTSEEFLAHVEADRDIEAELRQTVRSEYREVIAEVLRRGALNSGMLPLILAQEQRLLFEQPHTQNKVAAAVRALSPSAMADFRARNALALGLAQADEVRRLSMVDPNEFAVALDITAGGISILLGADLERGPAGCGWNAVLLTHSPINRASLYKVPHHGSHHADHPQVWVDLLEQSPVSVLAPFRSGSVLVPTELEVDQLRARSSRLFATASPKRLPASKSVQKTAAALSGVASNVRDPHGKAGRVRARRKLSGEATWRVDLESPARQL